MIFYSFLFISYENFNLWEKNKNYDNAYVDDDDDHDDKR